MQSPMPCRANGDECVGPAHGDQLPRAAMQILLPVSFDEGEAAAARLRQAELRTGQGDHRLRVGALKLFIDGGFTGSSPTSPGPSKDATVLTWVATGWRPKCSAHPARVRDLHGPWRRYPSDRTPLWDSLLPMATTCGRRRAFCARTPWWRCMRGGGTSRARRWSSSSGERRRTVRPSGVGPGSR